LIRKRSLPDSGAHGLVADEDGNWSTAKFAGYIGKLDPKTGAPREALAVSSTPVADGRTTHERANC
jgi:streptogramin lyase